MASTHLTTWLTITKPKKKHSRGSIIYPLQCGKVAKKEGNSGNWDTTPEELGQHLCYYFSYCNNTMRTGELLNEHLQSQRGKTCHVFRLVLLLVQMVCASPLSFTPCIYYPALAGGCRTHTLTHCEKEIVFLRCVLFLFQLSVIDRPICGGAKIKCVFCLIIEHSFFLYFCALSTSSTR